MTSTIAYTQVALVPNELTGSRTPFVSPVFKDAFRKVEELLWEGRTQLGELSTLAMADWNESNIENGIRFYECWLSMQFLNTNINVALEALESAAGRMARSIDPRYGACVEGDCVKNWLMDGARLNLLKARNLQRVCATLQATIAAELADKAESACETRKMLVSGSNTCIFGQTDVMLARELEEAETSL